MGVLLVAPMGRCQALSVAFLKETIEWYADGRCFHVVRLFVRSHENLRGIELVVEGKARSVADSSSALKNPRLLRMLQEQGCRVADGVITLDGYSFVPAAAELEYRNRGDYAIIGLRPRRKDWSIPNSLLLALQVTIEAERRPRRSLKLWFLGETVLETRMLMPPSTVRVQEQLIPRQQQHVFSVLERKASDNSKVERYEMWVAAEGTFQGATIDSEVVPQRSQSFRGESVLEEFYRLPPLRRGWELKIDVRKPEAFYNVVVRVVYRFPQAFIVLSWLFGIATVAGLALTILQLLKM
jgi:hypothetical protein